MSHAIIIGGGLAGMLAAAAVARHIDRVTIVESDVFPGEPATRRGLPQGAINHMLFSGGADVIDELLPHTTDLLQKRGAHKLPFGEQVVSHTPQGWSLRCDGDPYVITCSRPLLDHVVRAQVLSYHRITVLESAKVTGLVGGTARVTGVRLTRRGGVSEILEGDLIIDAAGRRSDAPAWLAELGLPQVREDHLDAGCAYAARTFAANAPADFPAVLVQADNSTGQPGRAAALLPIEDGRWVCALLGTRGAHPPTDDEGWFDFARALPTSIIADLLATAEPIGGVRPYRDTANRRKHFQEIVPEGFVVVGDSTMHLNPTYASGMSLAAFGAKALREELHDGGLTPGFARRAQRRIGKAGAPWWGMVIGQDRWYPGVQTSLTLGGGAGQLKMAARWGRLITENADAARATYKVAALTLVPNRMMTPRLMFALLRGAKQPSRTTEAAIAQYPGLTGLLNQPAVTEIGA
ncbi:FAD-dependent oxidoreductase [Nocardia sp. NPDC051030]|uniref:NAD(P)/FAD-dependent oxidoreductase n=1 Tax=Nocardia sp. NPDC051030 TaxID=3155162 RepID=UPI003428A1F8